MQFAAFVVDVCDCVQSYGGTGEAKLDSHIEHILSERDTVEHSLIHILPMTEQVYEFVANLLNLGLIERHTLTIDLDLVSGVSLSSGFDFGRQCVYVSNIYCSIARANLRDLETIAPFRSQMWF
jgi:hypothetical protein